MTDEQRARLRAASITERNRAIIEIHNSGVSIRAIAVELEMSVGGVHKIIKQNEEPS